MQQSFLKCEEEIIHEASYAGEMSILHIDVFLLIARRQMSLYRFLDFQAGIHGPGRIMAIL